MVLQLLGDVQFWHVAEPGLGSPTAPVQGSPAIFLLSVCMCIKPAGLWRFTQLAMFPAPNAGAADAGGRGWAAGAGDAGAVWRHAHCGAGAESRAAGGAVSRRLLLRPAGAGAPHRAAPVPPYSCTAGQLVALHCFWCSCRCCCSCYSARIPFWLAGAPVAICCRECEPSGPVACMHQPPLLPPAAAQACGVRDRGRLAQCSHLP